MNSNKRRRSTSSECIALSVHAGKQQRRSQDDSGDAGRGFSNDKPTLVSLPAEVLAQIFHQTHEPALIHTCRSLYNRLPSFVDYTADLTLMAYAPRTLEWTRSRIPPFHYLTGIDVTLDNLGVNQEELQVEVNTSSWLTVAMLQRIHVKIYRHIVSAALLAPKDLLSRKKQRKVKHLLWAARHDYRYDRLEKYLGTTQDESIEMQVHHARIYATPNPINSYEQWVEAINLFQISSIPDCFLEHPFHPTAYSLLHTIFETINICQSSVRCSTAKLERAVLRALRASRELDPHKPGDGRFSVANLLMHINAKSIDPCAITTEMLSAACVADKHVELKNLLCYMNTHANGKVTSTVSVTDLLRLEMSLQPHQNYCHEALGTGIWRLGSEITDQTARDLGYQDLQELANARVLLMPDLPYPSRTAYSFSITEPSEYSSDEMG